MRPLSVGKITIESSFARALMASLSALLMFDLGGLLLLTILTTSFLCVVLWIVHECLRNQQSSRNHEKRTSCVEPIDDTLL